MVVEMKGGYPFIPVGVILFYLAIGLAIFAYGIAIRLLPTKVKIPVVSCSLEKIRVRLR
jgi:hypothetical protein